ncbi:MAG: IclR family transcriptional regulator [Acidimicrobiia bacterium]
MEPNTHQSVRRAAAILRVFTESTPQLTVSEVARMLGLHKSTVSRILATLADEGLVWHDARTGRYSLGLGLVELAGVALGQIDVRAAALPHVERLVGSVQETVTVSVLRGDEAVTIAHMPSPHSVRHVSWIGRRVPLRSTAAGKVFLAAALASGQEWSALGLPGAANMGDPASVPEMAAELRIVHRRGFATSVDEYESGGASIAAPIQDAVQSVVAAVALSGPAERFGADERLAALPLLTRAASDIAFDLGARGEVSA